MYKFIVLALIVAVANAGLISHGHIATVAVETHHGAESYQNSNLWAVHPTPIKVATVAHAPIIHAAPIAVAHAPIALGYHGIH